MNPKNEHYEMDQNISKHTSDPRNAIKKETIVHSGIGKNFSKKLHNSKKGVKIHLPAYTSCSTVFNRSSCC